MIQVPVQDTIYIQYTFTSRIRIVCTYMEMLHATMFLLEGGRKFNLNKVSPRLSIKSEFSISLTYYVKLVLNFLGIKSEIII